MEFSCLVVSNEFPPYLEECYMQRWGSLRLGVNSHGDGHLFWDGLNPMIVCCLGLPVWITGFHDV